MTYTVRSSEKTRKSGAEGETKALLDIYSSIPNQVIFTTTLKTEELGKYDKMGNIHHIDYKDHIASKMLTCDYLPEFKQIMSSLSINV